MRILVTGGLGFIGSNFILKLIKESNEFEIINVDAELYGSDKNNLLEIQDHEKYEFVKGNITNPEEIKYREGDKERFLIKAKTSDKLLIFGTNGHIYTLLVNSKNCSIVIIDAYSTLNFYYTIVISVTHTRRPSPHTLSSSRCTRTSHRP